MCPRPVIILRIGPSCPIGRGDLARLFSQHGVTALDTCIEGDVGLACAEARQHGGGAGGVARPKERVAGVEFVYDCLGRCILDKVEGDGRGGKGRRRRTGDDETAPGYTIQDELPDAEAGYEEGMVVMANTGDPDTGAGQWFIVVGADGEQLPPSYSVIGRVTKGYDSTVRALENLADPLADNGVPPLLPITIESITITES